MRFRALEPHRFVGAAAQAREDGAMTTQPQHRPHEPGDVNARRVVIVAGSILAFVFISITKQYKYILWTFIYFNTIVNIFFAIITIEYK
jgi:uncharacterized protein (DUF983 family)